MSSLPVYLQSELTLLSNESRRKYPEIKEACEKVIMIMRVTKDRTSEDVAQDLAKTEETLKPISLACNTKLPKLVGIAIACLQKLILHKAVSENSIGLILRILGEVLNSGTDVQLKVLQTVLPLITNYDNIRGESLNAALLLCFKLQESKIAMVNNTAAATLRQLFIIIFDKKIRYDHSDHVGYTKDIFDSSIKHDVQDLVSSLSPDAKDAYFLFQDLCFITNGEPPLLLKLPGLNKIFGLELIESVLTNQSKVFQVYPEFTQLLKDKLCPLILKGFSEKFEFAQTLRIMRLICLLIRLFSHNLPMECEIFLSMLLKVLEPENILWHRVLAAEVIKDVCSKPKLLRSIYKGYDQNPSQDNSNLFREIINQLGKLINENPFLFRSNNHTRTNSISDSSSHNELGLSVAGSSMKIQCIDLLDKTEPPPIPNNYLLYLAINCIEHIINGLCKDSIPDFKLKASVLDVGENQEPFSKELFKETDNLDLKIIGEMVAVSWSGLLASFNFLIKIGLDESLTLTVVHCLKNFSILTALYRLDNARDSFLNCLGTASFPQPQLQDKIEIGSSQLSNSIPILTERHVLFLKALIYIAIKLSEILEDSWLMILDTLQTLQHLIQFTFRNLKPSSNLNNKDEMYPFGKRRLFEEELNDLYSTIKGFFENIKYLDDSSYLSFITALTRLVTESTSMPFLNIKPIENNDVNEEEATILIETSTNTLYKANRNLFKSEDSLFSIEQLRGVSLSSMPRLIQQENHMIWDMIIKNLIHVARKESIGFGIRIQLCETLSDLILTGMNCASSMRIDSKLRLQEQMVIPLAMMMSMENYPLYKGASTPPINSTLQKVALEVLDKLLHNSGHSFTHCWKIVFDILLEACPNQLMNNSLESNEPNKSSGNSIKLVRVAFPCLQLICTDFLSPLPLPCLYDCIMTVSQFAIQTEDLNTSLTATSMLWNLLDFILKSLDNIKVKSHQDITFYEFEQIVINDETVKEKGKGAILIQLFLLSLSRLSLVCLDPRPEVRNGAIQTLFRTISNNGANLNLVIWNSVLWKILFPLLDEVNLSYSKACQITGLDTAEFSSMMFHHSRNTQKKQWDETRVLIIDGITYLIIEFLNVMVNCINFSEGWQRLLTMLKEAIALDSIEVSQAAVKAWLNIVQNQNCWKSLKLQVKLDLLECAFNAWCELGDLIINDNITTINVNVMMESRPNNSDDEVITEMAEPLKLDCMTKVKQSILTGYMEIVINIITQIELDRVKLIQLLKISKEIILYSGSEDLTDDSNHLSPLQKQVLQALKLLKTNSSAIELKLELLNHYIKFIKLSFTKEISEKSTKPYSVRFKKLTCVMLEYIADIYPELVGETDIFKKSELILKLYEGLSLNLDKNILYSDDELNLNQNRWRLAKSTLDIINGSTLKAIAVENALIEDEVKLKVLTTILDITGSFLNSIVPPPSNRPISNLEKDEKLEIDTLIILFNNILPIFHLSFIPTEIQTNFIHMIEKLSRLGLDSTEFNANIEIPLSIKVKEMRAFSALRCLIFICVDGDNRDASIDKVDSTRQTYLNNQEEDSDDEMDGSNSIKILIQSIPPKLKELTSPILFHRVYKVLYEFSLMIPKLGKKPLPRIQRDEILFMLRYVTQLSLSLEVESLKSTKDQPFLDQLLSSPYAHLFKLYPTLCRILHCRDLDIVNSVAYCLTKIGQELGLEDLENQIL